MTVLLGEFNLDVGCRAFGVIVNLEKLHREEWGESSDSADRPIISIPPPLFALFQDFEFRDHTQVR